METFEGQTFAGYEIVAKLGEGGMGAVYKARQPILNRFVALKTMAANLGGDKDFVARFQREAASAATLNHPNIVGVHTAGEADGIHYIVMEFVEGESARKRLDREGKLPPAEALAITLYVAQALQYAWNAARLIHRDIKPDNIFLSKKGEVKLGDLGLAKSVGAAETTELTQSGMAMGSPHYISPEQAKGIRDIDFRTDIYSLGCTLYHMLTGQTPYSGDSSMVVMMKHVNDPPPAIFKVWARCPMPLGLLVGKMLAKKRNERPSSYEQLIGDLFAVSEKLQQPADSALASMASPKPAVVQNATAPAYPSEPSPKPADVAPPTLSRAKKPVSTWAAVGLAAVLAAGALWVWSPWKSSPARSATTVVALRNLLPLVNPEKDAVEGDWTLTTDGLVLDRPKGAAALQLPYEPPEEYDLEIEFTLTSDGLNVNQFLPAGEHAVAWKLGRKESYAVIELLDGQLFDQRTEGVSEKKLTLEPGRRYASRIEVRRGSLRAFVNGEEYLAWSGDFNRLSVEPMWKLPDYRHLALGSYNRGAIFHRIEVREVSGGGRVLREP